MERVSSIAAVHAMGKVESLTEVEITINKPTNQSKISGF